MTEAALEALLAMQITMEVDMAEAANNSSSDVSLGVQEMLEAVCRAADSRKDFEAVPVSPCYPLLAVHTYDLCFSSQIEHP